MHMNALMMYTPMMHCIGSWAAPGNQIVERFNSLTFWQQLARTLEAGGFDMLFLADHFSPYDVYGGGEPAKSMEYGIQFPVHDPLALVPAMAVATSRLGFGVTMSTAYYPPTILTRKLSTLDHLTGGRMGWNVVTSFARADARALGLDDVLSHADRYELADEYLEVCGRIWDAWEPDAFVADAQTRRLVDPSKVTTVVHRGRYFDLEVTPSVYASPQRRPVIMQAGASPAGRDFCAKHAEVIFAIKRDAEDMARFVEDIEARAAAVGRSREEFKIIFGVQVIQAPTTELAHERRQLLHSFVDAEAGLVKLSGVTGVDFAGYDLDQPVRRMDVPGAQGILDIFATEDEQVTLREAAISYGVSAGCPQVVGSAVSIADTLEQLFLDGRGDGFNVTPASVPDDYEAYAAEVAPILRSRGLLGDEEGAGTTLRDRLFGASAPEEPGTRC